MLSQCLFPLDLHPVDEFCVSADDARIAIHAAQLAQRRRRSSRETDACRSSADASADTSASAAASTATCANGSCGGQLPPAGGSIYPSSSAPCANTCASATSLCASRCTDIVSTDAGAGCGGGGRGLVGGGIGAGVSTQPRKSSDGLMRTQDASRVVATDSTPVLDALSPLAAPTQVPYLQLPCLQLPYLQLP